MEQFGSNDLFGFREDPKFKRVVELLDTAVSLAAVFEAVEADRIGPLVDSEVTKSFPEREEKLKSGKAFYLYEEKLDAIEEVKVKAYNYYKLPALISYSSAVVNALKIKYDANTNYNGGLDCSRQHRKLLKAMQDIQEACSDLIEKMEANFLRDGLQAYDEKQHKGSSKARHKKGDGLTGAEEDEPVAYTDYITKMKELRHSLKKAFGPDHGAAPAESPKPSSFEDVKRGGEPRGARSPVYT